MEEEEEEGGREREEVTPGFHVTGGSDRGGPFPVALFRGGVRKASPHLRPHRSASPPSGSPSSPPPRTSSPSTSALYWSAWSGQKAA